MRPQLINPDALFQNAPNHFFETIIHPIPQISIVIDGVYYAPQEIQQLNGISLHFVLSEETQKEEFLYIFKTPQEVQQYLQFQKTLPLNLIKLQNSSIQASLTTTVSANFFEHLFFNGAVLTLEAGHAWSDLEKACKSQFLWWCTSDWNKVISSVRTGSTTVMLFEHINFEGSSLTIPPHRSVESLVPLGWNNRVSSILNLSW
jgi:hypothetical protein